MKKVAVIILASLIFLSGISLAEAKETKKPKCLQAVEFFTGFAKANLRGKDDYYLIPLIVDFDFDLKSLSKKIGFNPPGIFQFQLEPFISPVYEPDANIEFGNAFMLKLGILPATSKIQPYINAGTGMLYMTQHTREQSTQFNFFEQTGLGMSYFINKHTAVNLECRIRHVSNAGIDHPNKGINTLFVLMGVSYRF